MVNLKGCNAIPPGKAAVVVLHAIDPGESLMISFQVELPPKQVVAQALKCPLNGQALFLHSGIPGFTWLELAAQEHNRMFFSMVSLGQDCSKANCRCIHLHQKPSVKVWALEDGERTQAFPVKALIAALHSSDQATGFFWSLQVKAASGAVVVAN